MKPISGVIVLCLILSLFFGCNDVITPSSPTEALSPQQNENSTAHNFNRPEPIEQLGVDAFSGITFREFAESESYKIGPTVELSYDTVKESEYLLPLIWEVRYPKIGLRDGDDSVGVDFRGDIAAINLLIENSVKSLSDKYGIGFFSYDITTATEETISICFLGNTIQGFKPRDIAGGITIDIANSRVLYLSDFIDTDALSEDAIISDYTVFYKNSFVKAESLDSFFG